MLIAGSVLIFLQSVFANESLKNIGLYSQVYFLGIVGMTAAMTLISSISSYSQNQNTLIAVMSIPLLIPILLIGMRLSMISERIIMDTEVNNYLLMLIGIDVVYVAMLIIFIPLTWKA
jgi:heme exporter protein B